MTPTKNQIKQYRILEYARYFYKTEKKKEYEVEDEVLRDVRT